MMATWMLWATLSAVSLSLAGLLAERGLYARERSTRWIWLLVMATSVGWPFWSSSILGGPTRAPLLDGSGGSGHLLSAASPGWAAASGGEAGGLLLLLGWGVISAVLLVVVLLSSETLKADRRRWRTVSIAGHCVSISTWIGPAVIGALCPRIVLPAWVLDFDEEVQRLVVLHEREHVRGGDSRILAAGLTLLVLLPWCLPLWWQFHRLRRAIETDCDRRLVAAGAPQRQYAQALLAVAERRQRTVLPVAAMSSPRADLERRIRLIVGGASRWDSRTAFPWLAAGLLMSGTAAVIPLPEPPVGLVLAPALSGGATGPPAGQPGPPLSGSKLPGDPGQERLFTEIQRHHSDAISSGLPEGSTIWFMVDEAGAVGRTGILRGRGADEVQTELRQRYPDETSDFALRWSEVAVGTARVEVLWLLPPR